jgi:branched-chain amino acid transport system substrate-binding protein
VGALIPFTGDLSASGANLERALILAAERINKAGGIGGQPLRLIARDTHSDVARGIEAAHQLIEQDRVVAIIGPEEADLAAQLLPYLREHKVLEISGGAVASVVTTEPVDFWYRIVPSAQRVGGVLAKRMLTDGMKKVSILNVNDSYGTVFAGVVAAAITAGGGEVTAQVSFSPSESSFAGQINAATQGRPDATLLVAYPKGGAAIIQESAFSTRSQRWYLGPSLRTDVFLRNVSAALVENSVGVASALPADSGDFAAAFALRWDGEIAPTNAYFYFDALAVLGLAMQAATYAGGGTFDPAGLSPFITQVANPGGSIVTWDLLGDGLSGLAAGLDVNYRGVSGAVDFDEQGDVSQGLVQFWTIRSGKIGGS